MPAKSRAQQQFFGAELARKRAGEATDTEMTESQLRDFAKTRTRGLPKHVPKRSHKGAHKRGGGM